MQLYGCLTVTTNKSFVLYTNSCVLVITLSVKTDLKMLYTNVLPVLGGDNIIILLKFIFIILFILYLYV